MVPLCVDLLTKAHKPKFGIIRVHPEVSLPHPHHLVNTSEASSSVAMTTAVLSPPGMVVPPYVHPSVLIGLYPL